MFGMSKNDALAALEELTINRNVRAGMEAKIEADALNQAVVELRNRTNIINELRGKLDNIQHDRNAAATANISAALTLDHVIRDFARAAGVSEDGLRQRYNEVRTQYFNREVNKGMPQRWFKHDPRLDLSPEQKKWFVSGLDPEHGF